MSESDRGCGKDKEIDCLVSERDLWKAKASNLAEALRKSIGELESVEYEGTSPRAYYEAKAALAEYERGR